MVLRIQKWKRYLNVYILVCVLCGVMPAQSLIAATQDFNVRTLVGDDTTAPSIPTGLTATPITTSQINLSWASSTDDYLLSGYHVWRDDILIATTTLPQYSDTGLFAATSYAYYVTAFDSFFNESASSTVVIGTTLSTSTPTTTPVDTGTGATTGSRNRELKDEILSVQVFPQEDSVIIKFETKGYIRSVIKWGETGSYELGSLVERAFSKTHETTIVGLKPGTRYNFTLEGEDRFGKYGTMHTGRFVTLEPEDVFPPENVRKLTATREGDDVILSWINPTDPDFTKVRVVRSDRFFPTDVADGWVVYEGDAHSVRDEGATTLADKLYYTVFSYDALGNISSGAVVTYSVSGEDISLVDPSKNSIQLRFAQVEFYQDGIRLTSVDDSVLIDGTKQVRIRIPYEELPEHLKTILITLRHPVRPEETFSFILRINKDKTAYEGTLAPLGVSGTYEVSVAVFDYLTAQLGFTDGLLIAHVGLEDVPFGYERETDGSERKKVFVTLGIISIALLGGRFSLEMFDEHKK